MMVDQIIEELNRSRRSYERARVDLPSVPGLYGFFLNASGSLAPFGGPTDLVYIGKSESSLQTRDIRQHFEPGKTGHSTVRRSIGAILRREMDYRALPRRTHPTRQDLSCYRFRQEDEESLSAWMRRNLDIGFAPLYMTKEEICDIEKLVLAVAIPPLNIDGRSARRSPYTRLLRALRAGCKQQAAQTADLPALRVP